MFKKKDNIISDVSAKLQLELFYDYYDIDFDDLPKDQKQAVDSAINKLMRAIMSGYVEIKTEKDSDAVVIEQTLRSGEKATYKELSGQAMSAMSKTNEADMYGRMYSLLGSISGVGKDGIMNLKGRDLSIATNIGTVLLNV